MTDQFLSAAAARLGQGLRHGAVLSATDAAALMAEFGIAGIDALMRALLPLARSLARPPISQFRVGAVGRERSSGALVLGANLEFPGATLAETVHAEQFVFARAYHRGAVLDRLATSARPCGHCRQFMAEFAGREQLVILDPEGEGSNSLAQLLPHFFSPADLGQSGALPGTPALLDLPAEGKDLQAQAHVPYSGSASAVVLRLADGLLCPGVAIENAAYNPSFGALQSALVNLFAAGRRPDEIVEATLSEAAGPLDTAPRARQLLAAVAPTARFRRLGV
jgi:cytidine deaminase